MYPAARAHAEHVGPDVGVASCHVAGLMKAELARVMENQVIGGNHTF